MSEETDNQKLKRTAARLNFEKLTEHWRLVPEYVQQLRQRGEHEAADRIIEIALESPEEEI